MGRNGLTIHKAAKRLGLELCAKFPEDIIGVTVIAGDTDHTLQMAVDIDAGASHEVFKAVPETYEGYSVKARTNTFPRFAATRAPLR